MMRIMIVVLGLAVLAGCESGAVKRDGQRRFLLEVKRPADVGEVVYDSKATVEKFAISPRFKGTGLVYRLGYEEYEADYYNRFMADPKMLITEQTRQWVRDSGAFSHVIGPGSLAEAEYVVQGEIEELYGDFRKKDAPIAAVSVRFTVLAAIDGNMKIMLDKNYNSTAVLESAEVSELVGAYNECLSAILSDFEADLRAKTP
jgi:ABC-type uncharacterized transport system auxiliary subunit